MGREAEEAVTGHIQAEVYQEGEGRDFNIVEEHRVMRAGAARLTQSALGLICCPFPPFIPTVSVPG